MKRNEGTWDRIIRAVVGLALLAASFAAAGALKIVMIIVGAVAVITALTGFCLLYTLLGIDTNRGQASPKK